MSFPGQKSKFACLKVDDDSDSSDAGDNGKSSKKVNRTGGSNTLVVHSVQAKPKNRGKKKKAKASEAIQESGEDLAHTDDLLDERYQEDLRLAMEQSLQVTSQKSSLNVTYRESSSTKYENGVDTPQKDAIKKSLSGFDAQISVLMSQNGTIKDKSNEIVSLYRTKLIETMKELLDKGKGLTEAEADVEKYKKRYKKICELLGDVEVKEKAQLITQLDKAHKLEIELAAQIEELQGELMQSRSKIHKLETKNNELLAKQ